ncbi:hypothetical protein [Halorarum halobium]|uniref:hypothetical protein n=1 Tax=Halorarum halobium TaxID=3075121 RepID=UPI0028AE2BC7|nr:hypothetical protein [Halobaculum sp. XH14]
MARGGRALCAAESREGRAPQPNERSEFGEERSEGHANEVRVTSEVAADERSEFGEERSEGHANEVRVTSEVAADERSEEDRLP